MKTPLYGHVSQETAYMIEDYPYGRTLRCRRRVWIEGHPKHGFRFVSQTEHPTSKRWNKPHASTYTDIAACMYLDEQGHVTWAAVGIYTEATEALRFAQTFGPECEGSSRLVSWAERKTNFSKMLATGQANFGITVNGVDKTEPRSEEKRLGDQKESETWDEVARLMALSGEAWSSLRHWQKTHPREDSI